MTLDDLELLEVRNRGPERQKLDAMWLFVVEYIIKQ